MLMILLFIIISVTRHLICGNNLNWLLNLNLIYETLDWVKKWHLLSMLGMGESVLEEKSSSKMLGLDFSSELDWGSYIISIAKITSRKTGTLILSMMFVSPEVALYLYKSTKHPCMEYCCRTWPSVPSYYLELLDMLQKRICRTVDLHLLLLLNPWLIVKMWLA